MGWNYLCVWYQSCNMPRPYRSYWHYARQCIIHTTLLNILLQCSAVITRSIRPPPKKKKKNKQKKKNNNKKTKKTNKKNNKKTQEITPGKHPIASPSGRGTCVFLWGSASDWNSASTPAMMCTISCYIRPQYNGNRLYWNHCIILKPCMVYKWGQTRIHFSLL